MVCFLHVVVGLLYTALGMCTQVSLKAVINVLQMYSSDINMSQELQSDVDMVCCLDFGNFSGHSISNIDWMSIHWSFDRGGGGYSSEWDTG